MLIKSTFPAETCDSSTGKKRSEGHGFFNLNNLKIKEIKFGLSLEEKLAN